ncbi:hypothetical protein Plhal304r1_c072g0160791 [Plasmopara halstedii]
MQEIVTVCRGLHRITSCETDKSEAPYCGEDSKPLDIAVFRVIQCLDRRINTLSRDCFKAPRVSSEEADSIVFGVSSIVLIAISLLSHLW